MSQKKATGAGGMEQHISASNYIRKLHIAHLTASIGARLKSTIIWFPTHGLMPIVVADWLIQFFRLEAA